MSQTGIRNIILTAVLLGFCGSAASAEQRGVTDREIRIGQTMPYSGPLSAYSVLGKAEIAYFNRVNDQGGINGRKVKAGSRLTTATYLPELSSRRAAWSKAMRSR
jgi:hypothetical protein